MTTFKKFWAFMDGEGEGGAGSAGTSDTVTDTTFDTPVAEDSGNEDPGYNFIDMVPEKHREAKWVGNLKSIDDMFDQFANAQEMIGKKTINVPSPDASAEEYLKFAEGLRPETPDAYEFTPPQLPDEYKDLQGYVAKQYENSEMMGDIKGVLHKYGVPKSVAGSLVAELDLTVFKHNSKDSSAKMAEAVATQKQLELDFDVAMAERFGQDKDAAIKRAESMFEKYAPKEYNEIAKTLPGPALAYLVAFADNVRKSLGEDSSAVSAGRQTQGGTSPEELRKEAMRLMQLPEYRDAMHPNHDMTVKKVNDIYSTQLPKFT
jgi:hypothetical protein